MPGPLEKQTVPVDLKGGQDGKSSPNSIPIGKLALLQNCIRRKTGRIDKRFGFDALSTTTVDGSTISSGQRLFAHRDELGLISSSTIYSYAPGVAKWADRGTWSAPTASVSFSFSNAFDQALYDFATYENVSCYVWVDRKLSSVTVRCQVVDDTTGAVLLYDTEVSSSGDMPKVVALNGYFVIYYIRAGTLYTRRIQKNAPTTLSTEATVNSTVNGIYDIVDWNGAVGVAAVPTTSNNILLFFFGETGAPNPGTYASTVTVNTRGDGAVTVAVCPEQDRIILGYSSSSGGEANETHGRVFDSALNPYSNTNFASVLARNITFSCKSDGSSCIFFEVAAGATFNHTTRIQRFSLLGGADSQIIVRSVGLGSKAFTLNSEFYAVVAHDSALQPTYFLVNSHGKICGKFLYSTGGGLTRANTSGAAFTRALHSGLSRAISNNTTISVLLQTATQLIAAADGTTFSQNYNIKRYDLDFNNQYASGELGEANYFAGALVGEYDGVSVVESGLCLFPENVSSAASGADSALSTGTYYFSVVYEWINARGEREQSAPSILGSQAVTATNHLTITPSTLRITNKQAAYSRSDVIIVLYRSQVDDPTVLYRDVIVKNDPTNDSVVLTSLVSDAAVATGEILYTIGGELENVGAPACSAVTRHNNRLILSGLEDGNTIAYSKEQRTGDATAFAAEFIIQVEPKGGRVYAAASLDDKLIIFKKTDLYAETGEGPTRNGQFNDFQSPKNIATDVGCSNPVSIVLTPLGLMFQSNKGIYLLDRALQTKYIGDRVETYNDLAVTSAVVLDDTNEVRFTTSDVTMVYNYYYDEWSVFSNYSATSAIPHSTLGYCHLKSTGEVRVESSSYLDAGSRITMAIETGWLDFAGIQGFQRIWSINCMGEYMTQHFTRVMVAYDRDAVFNEIKYFDTRDAISTSTFGDTGPFGTGGFGSGSQSYSWRLKPRRQKCEAIKIRIEDVDTLTDAGGGSVALNALMFEVGVKGTASKDTSNRNL